MLVASMRKRGRAAPNSSGGRGGPYLLAVEQWESLHGVAQLDVDGVDERGRAVVDGRDSLSHGVRFLNQTAQLLAEGAIPGNAMPAWNTPQEPFAL
jgi:hypothetical protein